MSLTQRRNKKKMISSLNSKKNDDIEWKLFTLFHLECYFKVNDTFTR